MRSTAVALVLVLGCTATAAACAGDEPSAEARAQEAVCDDVDALQRAGATLLDDVQRGNLGAAADQVSKVESRFDALSESVQRLGRHKERTVTEQLTELEGTLTTLTSLDDLGDLGRTLERAQSQLVDVVQTVTDALSC